MNIRSRRVSRASLVAIVSLITFAVLSPVAQSQDGLRVLSVPEATGRPVNVSKALLQRERAARARGESRMISVIVRLADESLAAYQGKVPGLAATSPRAIGKLRLDTKSTASQKYLKYLDDRQVAVRGRLTKAVPNARIVHRFLTVLNGFSVMLPEDKISTLAAIPGVKAVYEDKLLHLTTENSPRFIGAPSLWNRLGGQDDAGEGVIVGVLDTGVWPEHPSFSDPDPLGKPYPAPPPAARQCEFGGGANPGPAFSCNNKLIGADRFMNTYDAVVGLLPTQYTSARDENGHGSHTSSTAAGNRGVAASIFGRSFGIVSGIAPRAHVMMYKVCGDQGCVASDSVAAIQKAIVDGVDVINFSIDGGASPYADAVSLAFLDAYSAGVFVATSAGNSGPTANTVAHREPWTMTVAASTTDRQFQSTLSLAASGGATLSLKGASITPGLSSPAPVFVPPPADTLCQSPFTTGSVTGMVVVCQRGGNARVEKGFNVLQGGAVGMIVYNPTLQGLATDNHFLPAVQLESTQGAQLLAFFAANTGVTASFTAGSATADVGDVMAAFSSRGGTGQTLGISKPDVTAPGVQVLAGNTPTPATTRGGAPGQLFQAIQGTSMSSPHVAGAAALLIDLHPSWTPGQIKSALMTSSIGGVVKEDGFTPADPFDDGSGRINLAKAGNVALLFDETAANYGALVSHLWDANYPSLYIPGFPGKMTVQRTLTSTRNAMRTWVTRVFAPSDLKISVPSQIKIPALGTAVFNISVTGTGIPVGEARHAVLELKSGGEPTIRFPITVVRSTPSVPLTKNCTPLTVHQRQRTDCTITLSNPTFDPATVYMSDTLPSRLKLVPGSVVNAIQVGTNQVVFAGSLAPATPPDISVAPGTSPAGYVSLSLFGVTPISGVGDETISNFDVPGFLYGTEVNTRIGVVSNGYLVIGGGSGSDVNLNNQNFPNAAIPNNVIAPYWTDLDPQNGGSLRIAILTDGADSWLVVEWEAVREFSNASKAHSFQVWIGVDGDANPGEDISIAYGPNTGNGDGGFLSVGAENRFGSRGQNTYFNGAGTLPAEGDSLRVTTTLGAAGETRTVTFSATGKSVGPWTNCAQMDSTTYFGTQTACVTGSVVE